MESLPSAATNVKRRSIWWVLFLNIISGGLALIFYAGSIANDLNNLNIPNKLNIRLYGWIVATLGVVHLSIMILTQLLLNSCGESVSCRLDSIGLFFALDVPIAVVLFLAVSLILISSFKRLRPILPSKGIKAMGVVPFSILFAIPPLAIFCNIYLQSKLNSFLSARL